MAIFDVNEGYEIIKPLSLFIAGMVIYSIFIFSFYKFLARKDIFKINLEKYNTTKRPLLKKIVRVFFYIIEHLLMFPLFVFCWFAILTMLLIFMSKDQGIEMIMLISVALVGTVRVSAYFSEDLSNDLAKMLPFTLLGIFLIDMNYISLSRSYDMIKQIIPLFKIIIYYLIFMILLELFLRGVYELFRNIFKKSKKVNSID